MKKIIIFGTGKHAVEIYNYMVEHNQSPAFFAEIGRASWRERV